MNEPNELIDWISNYSDTELRSAAAYYDRMESFPENHVKTLFGLELFKKLYSKEDHLPYKDYLSIIRKISKNFPALGSILLTQESHSIWPLVTFGTEKQKESYLSQLLSGEIYGSFALNEPITGSEIEDMDTLTIETEDGWVMNGKKEYISNSPIASVFLVASKIQKLSGEESLGIFIIEKGTVGLSVGDIEKKMGIKSLPVAGIELNQIELPKDALLGGKEDGATQIQSILNRNRLSVAAQSLGIAGGALERGLQYVSYDRNLGKRLIDMQSTQFKLAEIETNIYASRALLLQVIDENRYDSRFVAMAKLAASDLAIETAESIIQMTGGYGYMRNNDIERFVRDAKITAIYGSSSNRLKRVIAEPWVKKE
ncbi:acyl-CoA dehydrogenase family protein [Vagococcus sp. DIV0080]|uniref:Acyl-CoA dehydrogenase family protein n=1 Tax=Candidatus Vagococcus giribetii TaxID=2230876 RepID=A0ABS3HX57_9ENTE|nr:acyl-CoA dehydrogenase family protein [Vagococcus sp. DIV0080]MBO0477723.1 acyl-CoA dehydrogenase family protein [Vagococcus sp. DIV0080]